MNTEQQISELKLKIDQAIQHRKDALAEIAQLTQDDPTDIAEDIFDLAHEAWEYLEDARRAKAKLKALKESIKPACGCNCHY